MKRSLAMVVLGMIAAATPAAAESVSLLPPLGDIALREPAHPLPGQQVQTYAASSDHPVWFLSQWDIAGPKLPPFQASTIGGNAAMVTRAPAAGLMLEKTPEGMVFHLSQDGATVPCEARTGDKPRESDLLVSARLIAGPSAADPASRSRLPPLSGLRALWQDIDLTVQSRPSVPDTKCKVSKVGAMVALILTNRAVKPPQTLFYQFTVASYCRVDVPGGSCGKSGRNLLWFSQKPPFGVDDRMTSVDQTFLGNGEHREIRIDVLPRLLVAVANPPPGMDHDPSHWIVTGAYAGQVSVGSVVMSSEWRRWQITADLR